MTQKYRCKHISHLLGNIIITSLDVNEHYPLVHDCHLVDIHLVIYWVHSQHDIIHHPKKGKMHQYNETRMPDDLSIFRAHDEIALVEKVP